MVLAASVPKKHIPACPNVAGLWLLDLKMPVTSYICGNDGCQCFYESSHLSLYADIDIFPAAGLKFHVSL
jgi:hypothetical protein